MASMTRTSPMPSPKPSPKPVVKNYTAWVEAEVLRKKAEEDAQKAKSYRKTEAQIRNGELASHLGPRTGEVNPAIHHATPSSSSSSPTSSSSSSPTSSSSSSPTSSYRQQGMAKLDGRPMSPPAQPRTLATPSVAATNTRICALESQLATQSTRIQELETSRDELSRQVADLRNQRDDEELKLLAATAANMGERREQDETMAELSKKIKGLIEERKKLEAEIEEERGSKIRLMRDLEEEQVKVMRLEEARPQPYMPDRLDEAAAAAAAEVRAPSTMGAASSRRASAGESERRRHAHRRTHSDGPSISLGLELTWGDKKEKKKKKSTRK